MTRAKRIEAFAIALTNRLIEDDYTVLLGSDEFNALRAALSEEGEEPLPQGFPYTVPGEEYSRGFKDGVEAAAKEAEGYAVQKQTQHLHPTAYALREVATRTRSLAHPSPAKDEAEPLDPLIEPLCRCGFMAKEAARWIHRADCEFRVPPSPAKDEPRFRLEGAGLVDTVGGLDLCAGRGKLPPHAGCKAICAACAPPTGACYCEGCKVAGRAAPEPEKAQEPRCVTCGGNWFNAVGGCVRCCLSAGAKAAAYAVAPPQPAPVSETKGEGEPVRPAYKMRCQPCGGTGRVWSEGASRPCDACASTGRRHEP